MIYEDNSAKIMRQLRGPIADFVGEVAMTTVRNAKENISGRRGKELQAVDFGRLMNSITVKQSEGESTAVIAAGSVKATPKSPEASNKDAVHKPSKRENAISAVVGSNVEYAAYVELGTMRMRPRPFLRRALAATRSKFGI